MPTGMIDSLAALYWDERSQTLYVRRRGEAPFMLELAAGRAASVASDLACLVRAAEKDEGTERRTWQYLWWQRLGDRDMKLEGSPCLPE